MLRCTVLAASLGLTCAAPAAAEWICAGTAPDWHLSFDDATAELVFPARTQMQVVQSSRAEGRDWPRAFTLIGPRDTGIVVLERESCGDALPYRAHLLTQRGQTPILLTGCCSGPE